ncbi:hypothetical protein ACVNF4_02160 [Streptomyces sp. S6]
MDLEKSAAGRGASVERQGGEGCLVVAVRIPVRIVVLVLVVPVRVVWDGLVVVGRVVWDAVLRPVGRGLGWLGKVVFGGLWRWVVVPVGEGMAWLGRVLVVVPLVALWRWVVVPVGTGIAWVWANGVVPVGRGVMWVLRGIGAGAGWLTRCLVVVPAVWLYTWVLTPVGHGVGAALYWTGRVLVVWPVLGVWRWVLVPVGRVLGVVLREVGDALGHAWRVAGYVSLAVWRFLVGVFRWVVVEPVRWVYATVLTPVGHVVRDAVLRPAADAVRSMGRVTRQVLGAARETAREVRADLRRALFGGPREREAVVGREPREREARILDKRSGAAEVSPPSRG